MQYIIDANSDYYIEVKKSLNNSSMDNELYVAVSATIYHKKLPYTKFKPVHSIELVYEKTLRNLILRRSWGERVVTAEKKLIDRAKKTIKKLPNLESVITGKLV